MVLLSPGWDACMSQVFPSIYFVRCSLMERLWSKVCKSSNILKIRSPMTILSTTTPAANILLTQLTLIMLKFK